MIDKSLAIVTDARFSGPNIQKAIETMLNISGEDSIDIDRKYHDPVSVRLATRIIVLSNEAPRLPDASGAIASRFLTVQLKHSFYGQEDILLEKDLEAELPSILHLFIMGLHRLMKRGHFVQPENGREIISEMNDLGSPIQSYVRDCCQIEPGQRIGTQCLFGNWRQWCSANGTSPGTSAVFGRSLKAAFPSVKKREGSHEKFYEGITLK
jgi:Predicted ATPase